jgi:hypothetical protein
MIRKEVIIHEIENGCVVSFYPLTDEETGDVLSLEYIFKTRVERSIKINTKTLK